jgi:hypothetical protein
MEDERVTPSRRLIVVVGPDGDERTWLARGLMERGDAVVLCEGPPGCSLVRSDRCPIVDRVDGVVVMPYAGDATREIAIGLTLCARAARCAVALEPSVVHMSSRAQRLFSTDPAVVGRVMDELAAAND